MTLIVVTKDKVFVDRAQTVGGLIKQNVSKIFTIGDFATCTCAGNPETAAAVMLRLVRLHAEKPFSWLDYKIPDTDKDKTVIYFRLKGALPVALNGSAGDQVFILTLKEGAAPAPVLVSPDDPANVIYSTAGIGWNDFVASYAIEKDFKTAWLHASHYSNGLVSTDYDSF